VTNLQPVERRPDLALEWFNLAPCHQRCNRQKHIKDIDLEPQGEWVKADW
jgi:5-methylcytosine-specific restriction endonuclease McrA